MAEQELAAPTQQEDLVHSFAAPSGFKLTQPGAGPCFAARSAGLYRSDDNGVTWNNAYTSLKLDEALPTMAVVLSPDFRRDGEIFTGVPGGVLHSSDGGRMWQVITFHSPPPAIAALVISPNYVEDGILLAGTVEDGVFRSDDHGRRWSSWNFGLLDLNILCLVISPDFQEDETIFAGTENGIFRSINGGRAWKEVNLPAGYDPVLSLAISPRFMKDGRIFAGTETKGVLVSEDQGETWTRLAETEITGPVNAIFLSPAFPDRPHLLILQGGQLMISLTGGQSWSAWQAKEPVAEDITAVFTPNGFEPPAPVLVGLMGGDIRLLTQ